MVVVPNNGQMVQNMKEIGETVWLKEEEHSIMQIEICTQVNSTKIEQMGTELTSTKMGKDTKENGKMICQLASGMRILYELLLAMSYFVRIKLIWQFVKKYFDLGFEHLTNRLQSL